MKKILIIEDQDYKFNHLYDFLNETYGEDNINIVHRKSHHGGLDAALYEGYNFDLIITDKGLPIYENELNDVVADIGIYIIDKLDLYESKIPIILFTASELKDKEKEILDNCENYKGCVIFDPTSNKWKTMLKLMIDWK